MEVRQFKKSQTESKSQNFGVWISAYLLWSSSFN